MIFRLHFPLLHTVEAPIVSTLGAQAMARRREGLDEVRSALKAALSCQRLLRPVAMRRALKEAARVGAPLLVSKFRVPSLSFPSAHARRTRPGDSQADR